MEAIDAESSEDLGFAGGVLREPNRVLVLDMKELGVISLL